MLTLIVHGVLLFHMPLTKQAGPEALITHGAFERLDVNDHVAIQAAICGEEGVTNITLKGLHSCWEDRTEVRCCVILVTASRVSLLLLPVPEKDLQIKKLK